MIRMILLSNSWLFWQTFMVCGDKLFEWYERMMSEQRSA